MRKEFLKKGKNRKVERKDQRIREREFEEGGSKKERI